LKVSVAGGSALAHSAGLTEEEAYEGWIALAIIAYAVFYPPLKTAYHIEQQIAGVLDQLYNWLGGVGNAIDKGVQSIESGVSYIFSGRWL
jgi:hypothetical protein